MGNREANCQPDTDNEYDLGDYVPDRDAQPPPASQQAMLIGELMQHIYFEQQVMRETILRILAWRPYILGSIWAVTYLTGVGCGLFAGWMLFG